MLKLALDQSGLLVASIPGALPSCPAVELDGTAIDADYRKRIVDAVLEFRARQMANATPRDPSRF